MFLIDKETDTVIPLKTTRFEVEINQGFADITLHQIYQNDKSNPLETLFMMPYSDSFCVNKIKVEFLLEDGSRKILETKVCEREKAQVQYNDAVATGKTAVLSYTESRLKSSFKPMLRIMLGNFPANRKAFI